MVDFRFATSIHILLALANVALNEPDRLVSSAQLAESTLCDPALIRKLLIPLSEAGLIETFRGKTGGVKLAKSALEITLREIYEASFDSNLLVGRKDANQKCPIGSKMSHVFKFITDDLEATFLKNLEEKTLDQLYSKFIR